MSKGANILKYLFITPLSRNLMYILLWRELYYVLIGCFGKETFCVSTCILEKVNVTFKPCPSPTDYPMSLNYGSF